MLGFGLLAGHGSLGCPPICSAHKFAPAPKPSFASILAGTSSSSPAVTKAPVKPILPDILLLNNPLLSMVLQPLPSKVWIGTGKDEGFYQKVVFEGKFSFCHHCNLQGHSPTECRKALAKKTPRPPPASTAVAPKLPLKQATSTSFNPPKAQDKPPQTTVSALVTKIRR